jgi:hypothetical protein
VSDEKDNGQKDGKLFGIIKSIFVVVISGAVAAWITHHYHMQEQNAAIYAEARKAATDTYYDIIDTIGKRHYYALRAASGFQWHEDEMGRWQQYDNMVVYWNEHRYSMLALTKRYFGEATEKQLLGFIPEFNEIHRKLIAARNAFRDNKPMPEDFSQKDGLLDHIYKLDDEISEFSDSLQAQLKSGRVDIYSPQPPLNKP